MNTTAYITLVISLIFPGYSLKQGHTEQIQCIAQAVYFESRGEPVACQFDVAHVIMNRKKSGRYPDNTCEIAWAKSQFVSLKPGRKIEDTFAWKKALVVAVGAYTGMVPDDTKGATNFYANSGPNGISYNPWPRLKQTKDCAHHRFLK